MGNQVRGICENEWNWKSIPAFLQVNSKKQINKNKLIVNSNSNYLIVIIISFRKMNPMEALLSAIL